MLACIAVTGCVWRNGRNTDCKWPEQPDAKALHLSQPDSADSFREDVEFAEELAVEYMDAHYGPRSGYFNSQQTASQALNGCLHTLIEQIAKSHNVPPEEVAKSFGRRSLAADIAMNLPFLALYAFLAVMLLGWLLRRYPR